MVDVYHEELTDLAKAYGATSLAFAILIFKNTQDILFSIAVSALTVGLGFVLHELAHRAVARHFKKHAIFRSNDQMLMLSILVAVLTPVAIAAPGAVHIYGHHISRRENGLISAAGPATNVVLAILFLALIALFPRFAFYGFMINAWLAIFNLIPVPGFDGEKVIEWSKSAFFGLAGLALVLNLVHAVLPNLW